VISGKPIARPLAEGFLVEGYGASVYIRMDPK